MCSGGGQFQEKIVALGCLLPWRNPLRATPTLFLGITCLGLVFGGGGGKCTLPQGLMEGDSRFYGWRAVFEEVVGWGELIFVATMLWRLSHGEERATATRVVHVVWGECLARRIRLFFKKGDRFMECRAKAEPQHHRGRQRESQRTLLSEREILCVEQAASNRDGIPVNEIELFCTPTSSEPSRRLRKRVSGFQL